MTAERPGSQFGVDIDNVSHLDTQFNIRVDWETHEQSLVSVVMWLVGVWFGVGGGLRRVFGGDGFGDW